MTTTRRVYTITLRHETRKHIVLAEWETTCSLAAMQFAHSFGQMGFGLFSSKKVSPEIKDVRQVVTPTL